MKIIKPHEPLYTLYLYYFWHLSKSSIFGAGNRSLKKAKSKFTAVRIKVKHVIMYLKLG